MPWEKQEGGIPFFKSYLIFLSQKVVVNRIVKPPEEC